MRQFDFATPLLDTAHPVVAKPRRPHLQPHRESNRRQRSSLRFIAPRRPLWAMFGFALVSFFSGLGLSYYCLSGLNYHTTNTQSPSAPAVYEARAVPAENDEPQAATVPSSTGENRMSHIQRQRDRSDRDTEATRAFNNADAGLPLYAFPELRGIGSASGYAVVTSLGGTAAAESKLPSGSIDGSLASVPEPAAWSMTGVPALLLALVSRRKLLRI